MAGDYPWCTFHRQPSQLETTGLQLSGPGAAGIPPTRAHRRVPADDVEGSLLPRQCPAAAGRDRGGWLVLQLEVDAPRTTAGTTEWEKATVDLRSSTVTVWVHAPPGVLGKPITVGEVDVAE